MSITFGRQLALQNTSESICNTMSSGKEDGVESVGDADTVRVRAMRREDVAEVHRMVQELAPFAGDPESPQVSIQDLLRDGFESSPPWFFVLVAERSGQLVGYALCNRAYSSWKGRAYYVENLYVQPSARRSGVTSKLLQELCKMAVEAGVQRIDGQVMKSNAAALSLYLRLGARDLRLTEGRITLRIQRNGLEAVAKGHMLPLPQGHLQIQNFISRL